MKAVTIFGSSHPCEGDDAYLQAMAIGRDLGKCGYRICNGGYGGIMEASARGAKSAGGTTIGVTCKAFAGREPNRWIDEIVEKDTLFQRLLELVSLGDAYVVLKGGTGTLLELAAVWELMNKGLMPEKPIVVVGEFWESVISTITNQLLEEGHARGPRLIISAFTPKKCVENINRLLR